MGNWCLLILLGLIANGVAEVDYPIDIESDRYSTSSATDEHPDNDTPFEFHAAAYMRGNIDKCAQYKDYKVCAIKNGIEITKAKGNPYKFYFRRSKQKKQIEFYNEMATLEQCDPRAALRGHGG
ncbi:GL16813 [Drosophila persimilis]|uniref:GL16813 n=1 Tax=Drosophila persimilis TaxID=7234 RepID=B4GI76_DROPE|nr:GL16813 [Drosophila persimilis]